MNQSWLVKMKPRFILSKNKSLLKKIERFNSRSNTKYVNQAKSGVNNFIEEYEKCHVQTTLFQKCLLGLGSGAISLASPNRGDMVAVMGEITGPKALEYIREKMCESEEGKNILEEKPRISSGSVDLVKLKNYPEGTLGKAYSNFLEKYVSSLCIYWSYRFKICFLLFISVASVNSKS